MPPNSNNKTSKEDQDALAVATENFFAPMLVCLALSLFFAYHYTLPKTDLFFCVAYPLYLYLANNLRFDNNSLALNTPPLSLGKGKFLTQPGFAVYMMAFQFGAVLAPLLVLVTLPPPDAVGNALATRLVLLFAQIATENASTKWHDVPRILAPIGFNAYALLGANKAWLRAGMDWQQEEPSLASMVHVGVAALNLLLWGYNLFVFLLLRVLPVYASDGSPTAPVEWRFFLYPVVVRDKTR